MLKVLKLIEKAGFTEAFSRKFIDGWHCIKRLQSRFPCCVL